MTDPKPGDGPPGTEEQLPFNADPTAPESVDMSGTDLLGALRGPSGIILDRINVLLDAARDCVPAPPLHDASPAAVRQWIEDAQAKFVFRYESRALAREVREFLSRERSTADRLEEARRFFEHDEWVAQMKRDGEYWAIDSRRRQARRPCRFRVDDGAWERIRAAADGSGVPLGVHLGALLTNEASRLNGGGTPMAVQADNTLATRFIRVEVTDDDWLVLRSAARRTHATVTAYVSEVVRRAGWRQPRSNRSEELSSSESNADSAASDTVEYRPIDRARPDERR